MAGSYLINRALKGHGFSHERLLGIIESMKQQHQIQAVILGGTELSLILRGAQACGIPLLDTTQIHVRAVVARLVA